MNLLTARVLLASLAISLAVACTGCSSTPSTLNANAEPPSAAEEAVAASERHFNAADPQARMPAPSHAAYAEEPAALPWVAPETVFLANEAVSPAIETPGVSAVAQPLRMPVAAPQRLDYAPSGPIARALRAPRFVAGARAKKLSEYRGAHVQTTPKRVRQAVRVRRPAAKPVPPILPLFDDCDCANGSCGIPTDLGP